MFKGREFRLQYVEEQFKGLRYEDLSSEAQRRLDDSIIHATIVRQDEPSDDQSAIYSIFERLNTGGTLLQPQEIRVALYHGELVRLLRDLNENASWRALYGNRSNRLKDQEMILRFFAFYADSASYERPMKEFLNRYMARNRNPSQRERQRLRGVFEGTVETIRKAIGNRAFRIANAANAAVIDSLMVAIAERIEAAGEVSDHEALKSAYAALMDDSEYRQAVERSTADEESVRLRLSKTRAAIATIS